MPHKILDNIKLFTQSQQLFYCVIGCQIILEVSISCHNYSLHIFVPTLSAFHAQYIRIAYKTDSAWRKIGNYEECDYRSWISILVLQCSISPVLTARLTDRSCSRVTCFRDGWINELTLKRALQWLLCFPLLKIDRGREGEEEEKRKFCD